MKLSEKTLEINICSQISTYLKNTKIFWFGLTQKQEAKAGFDACTKLNGRLFIFQFKASNNILVSTGERKFVAPHKQLKSLYNIVKTTRSVFYALPLVGETRDIYNNYDLLSRTRLLDVSGLGGLGLPTKKDGTIRKNGSHNMYALKKSVKICSESIKVPLTSLDDFLSTSIHDATGIQNQFDSITEFLDFCSIFNSGARGMVLYNQ